MKHNFSSASAFIWAILFSVISCGSPDSSGEKSNGTSAAVGNCNGQPAPQVLNRFDSVNILIETSGSMTGFMPIQGTQTKFQRQLDDLLANAESEGAATLQFFSAGQKIQSLSAQSFRKMLRQGLQETTASTALPNLLRQVANNYAGTGQVSLFISDFIYAPPNSADRDYISNDIRRALASIKRSGLAVAVYGFQSEFKGTYYPAGAKTGGGGKPIKNCCATELPYYIWAIGPEDALRRVRHRLLPGATENLAEFGYLRSQPAYQVLPGAGRGGSWYLQNNQQPTLTLDNTREIKDGELKFTIGVNLDGQANQWRSTDYMANNLKMNVGNGKAKIEKVANRKVFEEGERITSRDRNLLNCYTHYITVQVLEIENRNQPIDISLSLPATLPVWASNWTTDDDRRPNESGAKTYGLTDMMKGIQNLYSDQQEEVFSLPVTLQKAN